MQSLNMYIFNKVDMISCSDLGLREAPKFHIGCFFNIVQREGAGGPGGGVEPMFKKTLLQILYYSGGYLAM